MFDIGASELLVIVIVAILAIGPKDMPMALRTAGRWIGKVRRVSNHFRTGIDAMIREAELEEMEKKWKAQNEEIMARTSETTGEATGEAAGEVVDEAEGSDGGDLMTGPPPQPQSAAAPDAGSATVAPTTHDPDADDPAPHKSKPDSEPELPLGKSVSGE
ncbi:Sec-independent protein translocase protein TatB [Altererythrobacter sp.]|uniref:Sec-independent protein translocase protein TatB n=1 Tax=Altererythrobacter sp. TaxID=1872480 RepID=UPI003D05CDD6